MTQKRFAITQTQPEWLQRQTCGFEGGQTWQVLIDGVHFALVKIPGYKYWSSSHQPSVYAAVHYYLTDKRSTRPIIEAGHRLKDEGRATKAMLAKFQQMVEASEDADELVIL